MVKPNTFARQFPYKSISNKSKAKQEVLTIPSYIYIKSRFHMALQSEIDVV